MSKKIYIGIVSGILIGLAVPIIIKLKKEEDISEDGNLSGILDKANSFLLRAKNKADNILAEAEKRSDTIIEEAGEILTKVKEKTSSLHFEHDKSARDEIEKIKQDIELSIAEFQKKLEK
jgi:vacuolar-type H+-ATPase subunit H